MFKAWVMDIFQGKKFFAIFLATMMKLKRNLAQFCDNGISNGHGYCRNL